MDIYTQLGIVQDQSFFNRKLYFSMKVNLPNGYYFNVTDNSIDAYHQTPPNEESGKERQSILIGYCSSVEGAVKRITQHYASKQGGEMDIGEFLMRWRSIYDTFTSVLKDHKVV